MSEETSRQKLDMDLSEADLVETADTVSQVAEIKEAFDTTFTETSLPEKVTDLKLMLDNLSEEVVGWRNWHRNDYLGVIETLKSQVEEINNEWSSVSQNLNAQRERLESLLQAVPGIIETSTLKALTLRVIHLEQLVSEIFDESQTKAALKGSRRQFIISLVALGVTIILWVVFIIMNLLG